MRSSPAFWLLIAIVAVISAPCAAVGQDLRGAGNGKYNNHPASNYPSSGYVNSYLYGNSRGIQNNSSHSHGSHSSHGWNSNNWNNRGWSSNGWRSPGWNSRSWNNSTFFYGSGLGVGSFGPGFSFSPGIGGVYNGWGGFYPAYGGVNLGYGWQPNYYQSTVYANNYFTPYGVYYRPSDNFVEYYLPPYEPAELRWGPQAMNQFFGVSRNFAMGPLLSENLTDLPNPTYPTLTPEMVNMVLGERKDPGLPEPSLPAAKERAARYVAFGDRLFKEQRIHEAMAKYRDAVAAAPDLAASQFRLGLGYLATGRMEEAAESFKRGMQLEPHYVFTTSFNLEELYAGNPLAKNALLEGIARRTLNDPTNADYLFDVGVVLYLDGQIETARKYFAAARTRLTGADDSFLRPFLIETGPTGSAQGGLDL